MSKVSAQNGINVTLVDLDSKLLEKAREKIAKNLERVGRRKFNDDKLKISHFVETGLARVVGSTNLNETVKNTDLVIEAIVENVGAKQKLFSSIDGVSEATSRNFL